MKTKTELSDELCRLLSQAASREEVGRLAEMEFHSDAPTRMTVIAATLYSKAAGGELTAIKELLSVLGLTRSAGGVTLVDDIGKP